MGETVKNLSWQLLHGNYRLKMGPDRWDAMVREVGGPDIRRTDSLEDVPMGPFNEACLRVDEDLGSADGSLVIEVAKASVRAWANMNKNLVRTLRGQPDKMLEIFCDEVHPFFLNDADSARLLEVGDGEALVAMDNGLIEPFKIGLLEGFVELTGARANVTTRGADFRVRWAFGTDAPRASRAALLVEAVRAPFLTATVVPVLVGTAIAWLHGAFDWGLFLLTLLGAALFHVGANTANDYFDHTSGADRLNTTPTPFSGGSRVIQRGLLSPAAVRNLAVLAFAAGTLVGLYLVSLTGLDLLWIGVAGYLLGILYTAPPVRLAHRGLGELAVAAGFGPLVVVGSYFVQARTWTWGVEALWASLPIALLIAAVLYINEFPDVVGDARAGKRTLVVRLGLERAIRGYAGLVLLAYGVVVAGVGLGVLPTPALVSLLSAPLAWKAWTTLRHHFAEPYKLVPANAYTVFLHLATGILLAAGLFAWGVLA